MPIFDTSKNVKRIKELQFTKEKDIQAIVEKNLKEFFSLEFLETEFAPHGDLRIDTLAFDPEQSSFVIVEYKRGSSWSVIDQGYAYLALLLNNKAEFVLKYNETTGKNLFKKDINWDVSRVMFIAPTFNSFQKEALGFQDLPFEMWEIKQYDNKLVSLNILQTSNRNAKLSDLDSQSEAVSKVQKEVKRYTAEDHFKEGWNNSKELYDQLLNELLTLDSRIQINPTMKYIGLKIEGNNVIMLRAYKLGIGIEFTRTKPEDLKDPEHKVEYIKHSFENWNQHISKSLLKSTDDIPYVIMLAKQIVKRYQ